MRLLAVLLAAGCGHASVPHSGDGTLERPFIYRGMCDASGGVPFGRGSFLVADDEDNGLRAYRRDRGGPPTHSADLSAELRLERGSPEMDLEAGSLLGDRIVWISSHGRNKRGKLKRNRLRLFATRVRETGSEMSATLSGRPYDSLLEDLLADAALARFGLTDAATRAPKEPGGLNIEGLVATPDGRILIGFRNPIPEGRALLVPLDNPLEVLERGRARFGAPILVDLGGLGIRGMDPVEGGYLIVGGPPSDGPGRLFFLPEGSSSAEPLAVATGDLNPEVVIAYPGEGRLLLLSDDGSRRIGSLECKRIADPGERYFRGVLFDLPTRNRGAGAG